VVGPIGVALSTLILVMLDSGFLLPTLAARRLAIPVRTVFLAEYGGVAIGLLIVAVGQLLPVQGVPGLVVRAAACGGAALIAIAAVWRRSVLGGRLVVAEQPRA
jgi:hypothetical protein